MNESDWELLQRYRRNQAEEAFAELVRRYVNLVYSAALRQIRTPQLAEEIAQSVFSDLARNAAQLRADTVLAAWLHQVTRRTAIDVLRREARRQLREQIATQMNAINTPDANWTHIEPLLDEAVSALDEVDRVAVVLRYFENKSLREVGLQLGVTDDAAQKRVSRAVERLREFFAKRGVTAGASGLAVLISANAVQAAPASLGATISTAATTAGAVLVTTTLTMQTTMNWIAAKTVSAVLAAAVVAGTGTYFVQQRASDQLRNDHQKLAAAQEALAKERDEALAAVAANAEQLKLWDNDKTELMRLRGEVGVLRRKAKEADQLAEQNRQLQEVVKKFSQNAVQPESETEANPEKEFAIARMNQAKQLVLGVIMYAGDNADLLPTDLNSISNYLGSAASDLLQNYPFELVVQGKLTDVPSPATTIAVRSKATLTMNDKVFKVYGFADGHSEVKREPAEGFEAWEQQRLQTAANH
ncbi:MAG: sigma-70 family RNA polymerase sigma factor [Verrucomicrobiota bacterium]